MFPDAQNEGKILERRGLVSFQDRFPPPIPTVPPNHFWKVGFLGTPSFLKQILGLCK